MSTSTIGAIGVLALFVLLLLRVPVWIALTVGRASSATRSCPASRARSRWPAPCRSTSAPAYTLSVVPLFILMGEVASETGLSADLFKAARVILSGIRGGLAVGDARRLRLLRRGVRLVARDRRHHDPHRAAGNAQGRLRPRASPPARLPPAAASAS